MTTSPKNHFRFARNSTALRFYLPGCGPEVVQIYRPFLGHFNASDISVKSAT